MNPVALSLVALLVAMISIQSGAALARQIFPLIGPAGTSSLRLLLAAAMLWSFWRPWRGPPVAQHWRLIAGYGVALGCMNLLFYLALVRIPLGIAVALEFTGPLLLATSTSRQPLDLLWVGLATGGILMIMPQTTAGAPLNFAGISFALGAGACWAIYIVFGQKLGAQIHGGRASALGMAVAALCVAPFGVASAQTKLIAPSVLPIMLAVAFLSSALPYSLEMIALKRLPTRTFGILMSLEPAIAALAGLLILDERLSVTQWLATAAVIVASLGTSMTAGRKTAPMAVPLPLDS